MRWRWRWRTYRPGSYSVDAIGESSQWMVIMPSNGRCGSGRTIFASTCASTLQYANGWGDVTVSGYGRKGTRHDSESRYATVFCLRSTRHGRVLDRRKGRAGAPG